MSELDDPHIRLVDEGLKVHVPSVKGRPARDVPVTYGENPDTCPVRCWLAWQEAKLAAGAAPDGPTFLPVDQWGHLGATRLSPDGVGRAMARAAQYAGLTGRRITGHSGRRGLVTTGRKKGRRIEKLPSRAAGPPTRQCSGSTSTRARCSRTPPPTESGCDRTRVPGPVTARRT
ncbi:hypothetical protein ACIQFZ_29145 [Streptomyces sp. NPDC093064]|uniref:hypothetical protein n=1 Tax=Streptomyces sp. NPDC093064 TaxID=3366020 RepID=UPI00382718B2